MQGKALKFVSIMGGVVGAIVIAFGAKTLVDTSTVPQPAKPYDVAIYDVYSELVQHQGEPWLYRLLFAPPQPESVLIRVETEPGYGPDEEIASLSQIHSVPSNPVLGNPLSQADLENRMIPDNRFKKAVNSAIADFLKRNTSMLQLQRKFSLPHYDQFTKAEEQAFLKKDPSACQKYSGYERWVELSAVGFNQDQTVAVVHFIDWMGRPCSDTIVGATGKYRMLQNRGGKWHLLANQVFSDWILDD